jgi:hypothetical protein
VYQEVEAPQRRRDAPQVWQAQAPGGGNRCIEPKVGQQVAQEERERQGGAERPSKKPVSCRDPFRCRLRELSRFWKENLHQPETSKILDRTGGIGGEGPDQFDRDAVRRYGGEKARPEASDGGCRFPVEGEAATFVFQPDRTNDPERIFPEPFRRVPHATDPFPAQVLDPAERIEQASVLDEAGRGDLEEETVDGEVPPRRVVEGRPIGAGRRCSVPFRARNPAGARIGDVDVFLPPFDGHPVDGEVLSRGDDLSDARHVDGKRSQDVAGPAIRNPGDQQIHVPGFLPLDDVPKVPSHEVNRPSRARDRLREFPEKPAQGNAAQRTP